MFHTEGTECTGLQRKYRLVPIVPFTGMLHVCGGGGYDCMPYTLKVFRCPIIALWHPKILCSLHFQVLFLMTSTNKISAHWTIASKWFLSVVPRFQYRLANLEKSFWLRDGLFCRTKGGLLSDFFLLCLYGIFGSPGK